MSHRVRIDHWPDAPAWTRRSSSVTFLDDDEPLPGGDYCESCSVWMVPGFGCRHEIPDLDVTVTYHGLCCPLCVPLGVGVSPLDAFIGFLADAEAA